MKFNIRNKIALTTTLLLFLTFTVIYFFLYQNLHQIVVHSPWLNANVSGLLRKLFLIFFITPIIFFIFLQLLLSGFIGKPLEKIIALVREMSQGNFNRKIFFIGSDELGVLSESINYMSEQTNLKINDLTSTKLRLEAVLLSMFEGVMVVDKQGYILLMNKALRDFMSVTHDPLGRKPLEIIRNIEIQSLIDRVLKLKSGVETVELTILLPEEKNLLVHATPVIREEQTEGAVLVFHDITQLKHLEGIRRDFVANVSHELRTPVSTIKGYAETLLEGALEDKENARDFVEIIYTDADRLAKLINELLDLSQIESGNMRLSFSPCSVHAIVERVLKALIKKMNEKSIDIKNAISKDLAKVRADETSIAQVFLNLIENAIKYNKTRGSIEISAKDIGDYVEISISDTGIGIPEEDLPRIFERFYRVDKAHSRQLGGTGLGLAIVKHMVFAHQGEVSVESILDKGSTFRFTLPKFS